MEVSEAEVEVEVEGEVGVEGSDTHTLRERGELKSAWAAFVRETQTTVDTTIRDNTPIEKATEMPLQRQQPKMRQS